MPIRYPWTRYWFPLDATTPLTSDGFLFAGEGFGRRLHDGLTTPELAGAPCVVLLGEAGGGKTTELRQLRATECGAAESIFIELGQYGSEDSIERDVFDSPAFAAARSGAKLLNLYLDGVDEAILESRRLVGALQRGLGSLNRDSVRLRIACRSAAWPASLTAVLHEVYGEELVVVRQLAPLQRSDVEVAARLEAVAPDPFLDQVEQQSAGPLAANPTTLTLLLRMFKDSRGFPSSITKLYEEGLRTLCTPDLHRRDRATPLLVDEVLEVASRIAATLILTGRVAVYDGVPQDAPKTDLSIEDLVDRPRAGVGVDSTMSLDLIRRVLTQAGLFESRGPSRVGFRHKTFAEYLAARFLHHTSMPRAQLNSLLFLNDGPDVRIIPPLAETAGWLASLDTEFFDRLLHIEPEIVVNSDVSTRSPEILASVVAAFLQRVQAGEICRDDRWSLRGSYHRLNHAGLSAQLRTTLLNPDADDRTLIVVLDIISACKLVDLAGDVADIALGSRREHVLRCNAARVVVELGSPEAVIRLKLLAFADPQLDPDDTLKGCALKALWPQHLTTKELLQALTTVQQPNFYGSYKEFLHDSNVVMNVPASELHRALLWAVRVSTSHDPLNPLHDVGGRFATRALELTHEPRVLRALARLVWRRIKDHIQPVFEPLAQSNNLRNNGPGVTLSDTVRRKLVSAIIDRMRQPQEGGWLSAPVPPLIQTQDLQWAYERACKSSGESAPRWAWLVRYLWFWDEPTSQHLDIWLSAAERCPALADLMPVPPPVILGSPEAEAMKAEYQEGVAWREERATAIQEATQRGQAIRSRIPQLLDRCCTGSPEFFPYLVDHLRVEVNGKEECCLPESIEEHPGWQAADLETRARIVQAALAYLRDHPIEPREMLARECPLVADRAPALAVNLLLTQAAASLDQIPAGRWEQIAVFLVFMPVGRADHCWKALCRARAYASEACRRGAMTLVGRTNDHMDLLRVLPAFSEPWDQAFEDELLVFLQPLTCSAEILHVLLDWLLTHGVHAARRLAEQLLAEPSGTRTEYRRVAAIALARATPDAAWDVVWPALSADDALADQVLPAIAPDPHPANSPVMPKLSDDQVGALVGYLFQRYPPATDPVHVDVHWVSQNDHVRSWRSALLVELRQRGTRRACQILEELRDAYPDYEWLREIALEARRQYRRGLWAPPSPIEFMELVQNARRRFIESDAQLLDLVMESLVRFDVDLCRPNAPIGNFWDRDSSSKKARPKDENHLSDNLAAHLRRDIGGRGVVINREVEIRRRQAADGEPGERTDILVQATALRPCDSTAKVLSVIVETKGCWNREAQSAMETQLVGRYLAHEGLDFGAYVVGWFHCDAWDDADHRKQETPWKSIDIARDALTKQAAELSARKLSAGQVRAHVLDLRLR